MTVLYEHTAFPGPWRLLNTKDGVTTYVHAKTGEKRALPKKGLFLIGPDGKTLISRG